MPTGSLNWLQLLQFTQNARSERKNYLIICYKDFALHLDVVALGVGASRFTGRKATPFVICCLNKGGRTEGERSTKLNNPLMHDYLSRGSRERCHLILGHFYVQQTHWPTHCSGALPRPSNELTETYGGTTPRFLGSHVAHQQLDFYTLLHFSNV